MIVTCMVCQAAFEHDAAASIVHAPEDRYYLCSAHCREQFDEEPDLYLEANDGPRTWLGRPGASSVHG